MKTGLKFGVFLLVGGVVSWATAASTPQTHPPLPRLAPGYPEKLDMTTVEQMIRAAKWALPGCSRKVIWEGARRSGYAVSYGQTKAAWLSQKVPFSATYARVDGETYLAHVRIGDQLYVRDRREVWLLEWDQRLPWET